MENKCDYCGKSQQWKGTKEEYEELQNRRKDSSPPITILCCDECWKDVKKRFDIKKD